MRSKKFVRLAQKFSCGFGGQHGGGARVSCHSVGVVLALQKCVLHKSFVCGFVVYFSMFVMHAHHKNTTDKEVEEDLGT